MKKCLYCTVELLIVLLLVACGPSTPSASAIETAIAQTQAAITTVINTAAPVPTDTPIPTDTPLPFIAPTKTLVPTSTSEPTITTTPEVEKTVDATLISVVDLLKHHISGIDSITTISITAQGRAHLF